jgi:hypothetical protein
MGWFWLNIPLGMVFVLATAGILLWMVLRHPDHQAADVQRTDRRYPVASEPDATPRSWPVITVVGNAEVEKPMRRELLGADR